ncbi:dihydrodipicolinate synthase family protein [Thermodesulfobacteriota bacterium]
MSKQQIKGVLPPMITPFKEDGELDYDKHIQNMLHWEQDNLAGYVVLGSNSEAVYLTEAEKIKLIELTKAHSTTKRLIIAGTGMESTRETVSLTNKAAKAGADAALVVTPFYYKDQMNDIALIKFYTELADQSDIPVLIYNVTKFTHINISAHAVSVLSRHSNIIGMKDSAGDIPQLVKFIDACTDDFNLMVGTASAWYPALTLGIRAGIMALANCAPNSCAEVQQAFEAGDHKRARTIYLRLFPVNTAVTATYGVAGLKYAADLTGYEGGWVRSPLVSLQEEAKQQIKSIVTTAGLI